MHLSQDRSWDRSLHLPLTHIAQPHSQNHSPNLVSLLPSLLLHLDVCRSLRGRPHTEGPRDVQCVPPHSPTGQPAVEGGSVVEQPTARSRRRPYAHRMIRCCTFQPRQSLFFSLCSGSGPRGSLNSLCEPTFVDISYTVNCCTVYSQRSVAKLLPTAAVLSSG